MTIERAIKLLDISKALNDVAAKASPLPSEVVVPVDQPVLPHALFRNSRSDIQRVVYQINACYIATSYDACAVMARRLIEVLIIEVYEHNSRGDEVKGKDGNYLMLLGLVNKMLNHDWNLSRNTKKGLKELKEYGDLSAHSRRYNAQRSYIDDIVIKLRVVTEELLHLSGMR